MRIDRIKLSLAGEGSVIFDNSYLLSLFGHLPLLRICRIVIFIRHKGSQTESKLEGRVLCIEFNCEACKNVKNGGSKTLNRRYLVNGEV